MQKNLINKRIFWLCLFIVSQNLFAMDDETFFQELELNQKAGIPFEQVYSFWRQLQLKIDNAHETKDYNSLINFLMYPLICDEYRHKKNLPEHIVHEVISKDDPKLLQKLFEAGFIETITIRNAITAFKTSKKITLAIFNNSKQESQIFADGKTMNDVLKELENRFKINPEKDPKEFPAWELVIPIFLKYWGEQNKKWCTDYLNDLDYIRMLHKKNQNELEQIIAKNVKDCSYNGLKIAFEMYIFKFGTDLPGIFWKSLQDQLNRFEEEDILKILQVQQKVSFKTCDSKTMAKFIKKSIELNKKMVLKKLKEIIAKASFNIAIDELNEARYSHFFCIKIVEVEFTKEQWECIEIIDPNYFDRNPDERSRLV